MLTQYCRLFLQTHTHIPFKMLLYKILQLITIASIGHLLSSLSSVDGALPENCRPDCDTNNGPCEFARSLGYGPMHFNGGTQRYADVDVEGTRSKSLGGATTFGASMTPDNMISITTMAAGPTEKNLSQFWFQITSNEVKNQRRIYFKSTRNSLYCKMPDFFFWKVTDIAYAAF